VNAKEMTNPGVILGAEVANPWGAVCGESRMHGFDAGVGKRISKEEPRPAPSDPHLNLSSGRGLPRAMMPQCLK